MNQHHSSSSSDSDKNSAASSKTTDPSARLTWEELELLKRYDAPTVANAIETYNVRPRNVGFMRPEIRSIFPGQGVMVGYAVTARIRAAHAPVAGEKIVGNADWFDFIVQTPPPHVIVIEDLDDPPAVGSFWGEVQANIHRTLGCIGVVTNGGVRDLNEVEPLGFQFFAQHVIVSHAYVRIVDFGGPVCVGGMTVETGDLIHGDRHGVQLIPPQIARLIPGSASRIFDREHLVIDYCKSANFTVEGLKKLARDLESP